MAAVGGHASAQDAIGLLSLVVWALIVTVSVKYCMLVMRADHHGKGGILALMALATGRDGPGKAGFLVIALIYGDGVITPAISVISALESVNLVADSFKPYVMPAALVVLVSLCAVQTKGTATIGRVVGPVMLLWFATIMASQAIITGTFSLTRQAIQLGWFPPVAIRQTSDEEYGQIYVPVINWTMMVGCLALTLAFESSDRLAGAYGTPVSTTMLLTTALLYRAMRKIWGWGRAIAAFTAGIFLVVDTVFPMLMVNHVTQMKALQETAISLAVVFQTSPRVDPNERAEIHDVGFGIWHVIIHFGFLEIPNVAAALAHARDKGCPVHLDDAVYFIARDVVVRSPVLPRLAGWRRLSFGLMYRIAVRAPDLFDLPSEAAADIGRQISL